MVTFTDGPAAGIVLELRRAPLFLRAVRDMESPTAEWDALDHLGDEMRPGESAVIYQRVGEAGWVRLCSRGKGGSRSVVYATAEYRLHSEQPADNIARDTTRWRNWCESEWDRIRAQAAT